MKLYSESSDEKDALYLLSYINDVILPASVDFFEKLEGNSLRLHHVFSFNAILAHATDYIVYIVNKKNSIKRIDFLKGFDERYSVDGCCFINNKFELLDAVNNSFKHVELKKERYPELIKRYGDLSFHCLKEDSGKVFFRTSEYQFDYSRVVLRPIAKIFDCGLKDNNDIDDFINGRIFGSCGYGHFLYDYEPYDSIDRMIDYCNAQCMDCGEYADDCDCHNYEYNKEKGKYNPDLDPNFDFDDVMSNISGTREWSK